MFTIVNITFFLHFSVKNNHLDDNFSPKTPTGKTPVKRKSLVVSNKKIKKIKNVSD